MTRASRTSWPRQAYLSALSLRSPSEIHPKLSSRLHRWANQNLIVLHFRQIKFQKLDGSHIAKSTNNHSLQRLCLFPASNPGSTIANWGNLGSLAPLALVPASAPVSYLRSPDLNLESEGPGRTSPGCSWTTVCSPGMHLDSAGRALNPWRDCWAVSVPASSLSWIPTGSRTPGWLTLQFGMNGVMIVSKAFTTFLHHTMIFLDPVYDLLMQIPDHEWLP